MNWHLFSVYSAPIISGLILFFINKYYQSKPRLVASYIHASAVPIKDSQSGESFNVGVHVLVLKNQGNHPAKNVRLGHNVIPSFNIYPTTEYSINELKNSSYEIVVPTIVPKEQLTITYVYDCNMANIDNINTYIKHDLGLAEVIYNVLYIKPLILWKKILIYFVLFMGLAFIIYLLIKLITFFALVL